MRVGSYCVSSLLLISLLTVFFLARASAEGAPTTTTLTITSSGTEIASVASGSVVALTAKVKSGSKPVTVGQVDFCEAGAATCNSIHLLGMAQLTSAGSAVTRFVPGIGRHSYKAIFRGTPNGSPPHAASSSLKVALLVTGKFPTITSLVASGSTGDYTLTATVKGLVNATNVPPPSGKFSFIDTSDNNHMLATALLGSASRALGFFHGDILPTNPFPQSVAVADFDGDGRLDLAISVYSIFTPATDVSILLGNGHGKFKQGPTFPLSGQNVNNAAVGDFNSDGIPDLVISLPDANQVQVLLGKGDGTFAPERPISASGVFLVATGEFNGDGKADLAVVSPGTESVMILLGNGDGTFRTGSTISVAGAPVSVAVGDFNGDGIADLAVVNSSSQTASVFLGKGDGSFAEVPSSPATGVEPLSIASGDFNGDGILDLAVTNQNFGYPNPGTVTLLFGRGDGTFEPAANSLQTGSIPYTVSVADINGDGMADLVTSNAGSNSFDIFLGKGDGTFAAPLTPRAGTDPVGSGVGDFNGDGLPDLAAANNTTQSVTVLLTQETETAKATATGVAPMGQGQHLVDARYSGDPIYLGSVSPTVRLDGSDGSRK